MNNYEWGCLLIERFGGAILRERGMVIWLFEGCKYQVRVSKNNITNTEPNTVHVDGIVFKLNRFPDYLGIATFEKKTLGAKDLCCWPQFLKMHEDIKANCIA